MNVIAVDLGGTNVRVALVNHHGEILDEIIRPSHADQGPQFVLNHIVEMAKSLQGFETAQALGLGLPGPVDQEKGTVTVVTNLKDFAFYPIREHLSEALSMPVYIENDAKVAALGEATFGAGKGYPIVYYVTQSTGVGGGLVINGKIHAGAHAHAGEISNVIIDPNRKSYTDMVNMPSTVAETQVSGTAIYLKAKHEAKLDVTNTQDVFKLAKTSAEAKAIVDQMSKDMAQLLSAIAHIVNPDIFVLGGGVTKARDHFWDQMIEDFKKMVYPGLRETVFEAAELDEPGIIGAAALVFSHEEDLK